MFTRSCAPTTTEPQPNGCRPRAPDRRGGRHRAERPRPVRGPARAPAPRGHDGRPLRGVGVVRAPARGVAARERGRHAAHGSSFARSCDRLERFSYVSTAYVAGEPGGLFREDELAVGQSFRNPYERSKFEAELALRSEAADLPLQILRPSIVVGDSTTGRTTSFNVLYGPLKAFARGAMRAIPRAPRRRPVDIVPVDYVADRVHELATRRARTARFHLVAGRTRRPWAACSRCRREELGRSEPTVLPPRLYRRWVHPWLRRQPAGSGGWRSTSPTSRCACASTTAAWARGRGSRLLPPAGPLRRAQPAGAGGPALPLPRDREARRADRGPLRRAVGADGRPRGDLGPAALRRGGPRVPRARARAPARSGMAARDRRRRGRPRAARRGRRRPGAAGAAAARPRTGSPSSRRRSGSRWSSPTRTTTRT